MLNCTQLIYGVLYFKQLNCIDVSWNKLYKGGVEGSKSMNSSSVNNEQGK